MKRWLLPGRRVALVGLLTIGAGGAGVWAQQGTQVTLTKYEQEHVQLFGSETTPGGLRIGQAEGFVQTTQQPPAPEVTTGWFSGFAEERDPAGFRACTASVWSSTTNQNTVNVGPGATTGSIRGEGLGQLNNWSSTNWSASPAIFTVNASGSSDTPGSPNVSTTTWYSPDRQFKVTTHNQQFLNVATDGRITVSGKPTLPGFTGCSADVGVTGGSLSLFRQSTHAQQN